VSGGPVTIKIGGVAGRHAAGLEVIAHEAPPDTVVVHGGGNEVAEWSRRLGIEPRFHDGLRVTDPDTLDVVVGVLAGLVNTRLVAALASAGGHPVVGLTGADAGLLQLRRRDSAYGEVGEVVGADTALLDVLVASGNLPVVASIGLHEGSLLNVNADEAAGAIAAARGGRLLLCTDVPGVQRDGAVLGRLDALQAEEMLDDGSASAGMRPKLRAALVAARAGCEVWIVDGRSAPDLERALRGQPAGTMVTAA
jgi:acetylglutamate kinase